MKTHFETLLAEALTAIRRGDAQVRNWNNLAHAREYARDARAYLALARMELAREVVHAIDSGKEIRTPGEWALATKILKPLRLSRAKGAA